MAIKQFDPKKVIITVKPIVAAGLGAITLRSPADGEFILVSYDEDAVAKHISADGTGRFVDIANTGGVCTWTGSDYSVSHPLLTALEKTKTPFSVSVVDKTSTTRVFFTDSARVQKVPDLAMGKEIGDNAWPFTFIQGEIFHGAPSEIS